MLGESDRPAVLITGATGFIGRRLVYRKFFRHQYPWPLMPLVVAAVWARFLLLASMALFQPQESRGRAGELQKQVATMGMAAQEKRAKQPITPSDSVASEIDPMLVISSAEIKRPNGRLL